MVKDANAGAPSFAQRGRGGGSRGGFGQRGGRGGAQQRGFPQGPPAYVIPFCTYEHPCENQIVVKCTDTTRVPKFNRGVYLQSKAKIGSVDETLGPIDNFFFSAKLEQGVKAASLKKGQVLYMNPEDLLPIERFLPRPKVPGQRGAGAGGQRGGSRGGFSGGRGAPRGGFGGGRGGPRGGFGGGRGGPRGGGGFRGRGGHRGG